VSNPIQSPTSRRSFLPTLKVADSPRFLGSNDSTLFWPSARADRCRPAGSHSG
jgi:hypothetical protein